VRHHTRQIMTARLFLCAARLFLCALTCDVCVVEGQQMCGLGQERNLDLIGSAIICIPCKPNHYKGPNDAACKMCASETQAISSASTVCVACATDSLFSRAVDPASGTTSALVLCSVCPTTRSMVQELIEKGTLQGSLEDFEAASYFIDSVSSCRSNVRINMVADLMQPRRICPAGQYGSVENADQNTICAPCPMGTYSATSGWHACLQLEICSGQRMDSNPQTEVTGQTQQSTCVQDFDLARVNAGYYPRLNTRDTQQVFTYDMHRYVEIHEYVACADVASNTRLCADSVSTRCVHAFLAAWIAGSISLQTLASNSEYACIYTCQAGFALDTTLQTCMPCARGTYKAHSGTAGVCVSCESGKINAISEGVAECQDCPVGQFSYNTTMCADLCHVGQTYTVGHYCFRSTPWYIRKKSSNKAINISPCNINSELVIGEWIRRSAGMQPNIQWQMEGENVCLQMQTEDFQNCATQALPPNTDSFIGASCTPRCVAQHYRTYNTQQRYECVPCDFNYERIKLLNCAPGTYLAEECFYSENTRCIPCDLPSYHILDTNLIAVNSYKQQDRCKIKCIGPLQIAGMWWFFDTPERIKSQFNVAFDTNVGCIRSNVSFFLIQVCLSSVRQPVPSVFVFSVKCSRFCCLHNG